ncbi:MAG: LytTR family transcriptional regulator DNA-binding domain-containing protein [Clostridia bacterium]|nr:LytTR family transcriptional regulator DNA-binding domain-containing protein [Clostridia bacterium]
MKICLMPHPKTLEHFSYLNGNFRGQADIEICFPDEDLTKKHADIFLLEEDNLLLTERLLSSEKKPLIVIVKKGVSNKHVRYLPEFPKGFSKLLDQITESQPLLWMKLNNQDYFYNQKDILWLTQDKKFTVYFRYGTHVTTRNSAKKAFKQLSPNLFFPVGEHTFVNAEYVSKLTKDSVYLQNGYQIPFDSAMAEQVKNAFFKTKYLNAKQPAL